MSCDIVRSDVPGPHICARAESLLHVQWDMLIAFPPCTYLSNAGAAWKDDPRRQAPMRRAASLFMALLTAPIPRIAIENPVHHDKARALLPAATALSEPFWFGDPWRKRTHWWLRGLQPLIPTRRVTPLYLWVDSGPRESQRLPPLHTDARMRALTPKGTASAIADQWGSTHAQTLF